MERSGHVAVLDRLHRALAEVYAGGEIELLRSVLSDDVEWRVPGRNAIAGTYRGINQVFDYFARRRELAGNTLRLHPRGLLAGEGPYIGALTDGTATLGGKPERWSTVGLYEIRDGLVVTCWLLPLDSTGFDRAWSQTSDDWATRSVGSEPQPVLILTGPPGVGKTTVARALADRYERAVHLESDWFFRFIRSGFLAPWKPESQGQNRVVMDVVGDAAAGYAEHGYVTIIDGIVMPRWFLEPLAARLGLSDRPVAYAVLRAPLDTCIERCGGRGDTELADPEVVEQLWREFADLGELERHAIDITDLPVNQVVVMIEEGINDQLLIRGLG